MSTDHLATDSTLPFLLESVPEEFQEKAQKELKETAEKKEMSLEELRKRIKAKKYLKDTEFNEDFLMQFLRHAKFNARRAFKRIKYYNRLQRNHLSLFESIGNKELLNDAMRMFITVLPYRCPDGCTLILVEPGRWDVNHLDYENFKRIMLMTFQQTLRDPMTQINGYKIILDYENTDDDEPLAKCFTPSAIYLQYHTVIECFPCRYKQVHCLNPSSYFKILWNFLRPFLSEKIKSRVYIHKSPEEILQYLPTSVVPDKYGGELKDYHMKDWLRIINEEQSSLTLSGQSNFY